MKNARGLSESMQDEIVAYLDGELDAERSQRVERLIAEDEHVRSELQRLQKTWDLLDELPSQEAGEAFTRTTLAMATLAVDEEAATLAAREPRARASRWTAVVASVFVALAIGYVATRALLPDPNAELLRDLQVIENLDEYRQVGEIEFLRALADERLFGEEATHVSR